MDGNWDLESWEHDLPKSFTGSVASCLPGGVSSGTKAESGAATLLLFADLQRHKCLIFCILKHVCKQECCKSNPTPPPFWVAQGLGAKLGHFDKQCGE